MRLGTLLLLVLCLRATSWTEEASGKPWPVPAHAKARRNPVPARPESIAQGRKLYRDHCLICHGPEGRGDGPWMTKLPEPPSKLTPTALRTMSDGEIFWKISQGRDLMPGFERQLGAEQRWHLVNYLRALAQPVEERKR